jgi:hypothetical protein
MTFLSTLIAMNRYPQYGKMVFTDFAILSDNRILISIVRLLFGSILTFINQRKATFTAAQLIEIPINPNSTASILMTEKLNAAQRAGTPYQRLISDELIFQLERILCILLHEPGLCKKNTRQHGSLFPPRQAIA